MGKVKTPPVFGVLRSLVVPFSSSCCAALPGASQARDEVFVQDN